MPKAKALAVPLPPVLYVEEIIDEAATEECDWNSNGGTIT